jgi:hypothetical protein
MHYIDDLLPHAPLPLCSYWGHGQVSYNIITVHSLSLKAHGIVADQLGEADERSGYIIETEPVAHVFVTLQRLLRKFWLQKTKKKSILKSEKLKISIRHTMT